MSTMQAAKGNKFPKLSEFFEAHPEKRASVMKHMQESMLAFMNKGTVRYNIVHHGLLDYLDNATDNEIRVREGPPGVPFRFRWPAN